MNKEQYRAMRERIGTQAEVSAQLQVSRVTVAKRETGTMVITKEAALALSALAGSGKIKPSRHKQNTAAESPN